MLHCADTFPADGSGGEICFCFLLRPERRVATLPRRTQRKKREIPAENRRNRPPVFTRLSLFSIRQQSARSVQVKQPPSAPGGTYANEVRKFLFFNVNFIEREIGASTNGSLPPLMSSSWIFNERPLPPAAGFTGRPPGSLFKDFPQFPFFLIFI